MILLSVLLAATPARALEPSQERFPLVLPSGTVLSVQAHRYALPSSKAKLPVVLLFGGFEGAAHVLELFRADRPVYLASFDYPYEPQRKFDFPGDLRHIPAARRAIHDTLDGIQALGEELRRRPDLDGERMSIVGASFGAPFAIHGAAASPGIFTGLVVIHGFADVRRTLENRLRLALERKQVVASGPLSWAAAWVLWGFMGVPHLGSLAEGLRAPQRVLVIGAESDQFIPREVSASLKERLLRSEARVTFEKTTGEHLMPGADQLISRLLTMTSQWMAREGLL